MPTNNINDLYDEVILDHCRNPRNAQPITNVAVESSAVNPFCGDEVKFQFALVKSNIISNVYAKAIGCSINQASASILSQMLKGKSLKEIDQISKTFRNIMMSDNFSCKTEHIGELSVLLSVKKFPVRIKCVLLSYNAVDDGIHSYLHG